jgi:HJR/Mrr/RecB family endonuclease
MKALPRLPYQRSLRKLLHRLTVIWFIIYVPAILILAVRGEVVRSLQWLVGAPPWLLLLAVLHGLVVVAGWSAVAYNWWMGRRRQIEERIIAHSLADLHTMPPKKFESFVGQTLKDQGFKVWDTRYSADHGIDLQLITPDGAPAVAQIKRYKNHVGEPVVRDLFGAMVNAGADRAYLISTGGFSEPAREWAQGKPITLIDGKQLLRMNEN